MLEPIVSFFEKLIDNFSWRRLTFLLVTLSLAATAAWIYESYTQTFRLAKIERQISLLEKLASLDANKSVSAQPALKRSYAALQSQLLSTTSESEDEYELLPWAKKMLATAVAWCVFSLFLLFIPDSYSTVKSAPGAMLFGILAVAVPFIVIAAAIPSFEPAWLNYTLYPIGHLVALIFLVLAWQRRKQRQLATKHT
jgi:hypothetical protein